MTPILFFLALSLSSWVAAQDHEFSFSLLRQDDDVDAFDQKESPAFYNKLKYSELSTSSYLSFGGSYRGQYEYFRNEEFSFSPNKENGWYLQRLFLHSNLNLGEKFRLFGELGSSIISGKEDLAPVDQDELYVNQLFMEYQFEQFNLRVGRENLALGSNRLLDPREGPNVRQSFDHITARWQKGSKEFSLFAGSLVQLSQGPFDNEMLQDQEYLWGLYGSKLVSNKLNLDAYYIGFHRDKSVYALGVEEEFRHSLGIRAWKNIGQWQYDNETILQLGTFGNNDIFAWTISFNISNQVHSKHTLGLKTELISGTTSEETLGTFNPLYPRGAYFGRVARFGPANLIDIHPYWTFRSGKFMMEIDYDVFWRFSTGDAVYGPPMNIVLEGNSDERFIAQQIGTIFNYEFNTFAVVELETNLIFPGSYIDEVRPGANTLFHTVFTFELKF